MMEIRSSFDWRIATPRALARPSTCSWREACTCGQPTPCILKRCWPLPSVRNERHVYVNRQEMLQLAKAADRSDSRALIRIAFYTGMRLGEIQRAVSHQGLLVLSDTKNGERRVVPVHPRIRVCLKYLPFTGKTITLQRAFPRAREKANLSHVRIHDLRHSAASEMINAGVDLYTVGAMLGHKDARSTQRYAHLAIQTLRRAVNTISGQKSSQNRDLQGTSKANSESWSNR